MTSIAPTQTIFASDDLFCVFEWRSGTRKAPGLPIDLSVFVIDSALFKDGSKVADAVVSTEPSKGRISILVDEIKTASLSGEYELRVRYTDTRGITKTFLTVPVEVRK